jgi:hypothetical protein
MINALTRMLAGFALGAVLVGCAMLTATDPPAVADPVIDTWPVGPAFDWATRFPESPDAADEWVRVGLAGLDDRERDHPAVVATEWHEEGLFVDPETSHVAWRQYSGGPHLVLVMTLADGSTRAIGVATGIGPPWAAPEFRP